MVVLFFIPSLTKLVGVSLQAQTLVKIMQLYLVYNMHVHRLQIMRVRRLQIVRVHGLQSPSVDLFQFIFSAHIVLVLSNSQPKWFLIAQQNMHQIYFPFSLFIGNWSQPKSLAAISLVGSYCIFIGKHRLIVYVGIFCHGFRLFYEQYFAFFGFLLFCMGSFRLEFFPDWFVDMVVRVFYPFTYYVLFYLIFVRW